MKKLTGSRIGNLIVVAAVVIVPLLYAGLLTLAYQNPTNRLGDLTAAVVNNDTAYTATLADGSTEKFNLGHELEERLVHPDGSEDVGFTWKSMDAATAEADMKTEKVRAILYIPAGFSEKAAAVGSKDPSKAATQELRLVTDDGVNYLAGTMAKTVAVELTNKLTDQGSERVLDTLLLSVSTIRDGMQDAADGSATLAEGATKLDDGAATLHEGTTSAVSGAAKLNDGAGQVATGANSLTVGIKQLADGSVTLENGLVTLANGTATAADGSTKLASGLDTLAAGTQQLKNRSGELASGASQLTSGSSELQAGVSAYTQGVSNVNSGAQALKEKAGALVYGLSTLSQKLGKSSDVTIPNDPTSPQTLYGGVNALAAGATTLVNSIEKPVGNNPASLLQATAGLKNSLESQTKNNDTDNLAAYLAGVKNLAATCTAAGGNQAFCTQLNNLAAQNDTVSNNIKQAATTAAAVDAGVQAVDAGAKVIQSGAIGLQEGLAAARQGVDQLAGGVGQTTDVTVPGDPKTQTLMGGINALAGGLDKINSNSAALNSGASKLSGGLSQLNDKVPSLISGINALNDGAGTAASSSHTLASGLNQLSAGATSAKNGAGTLSSGLATAHSGSATLANGASQLADGTATLADGAKQLDDGAAQLADGTTQLKDGSATLADGIKDGVNKIPNYSTSDRTTMAKVGADAANVEAIRANGVHNNGAGFTPMFMSLSLWVGAIALFLVLPALDKRDHGEKWWASAIRPATTALLLAIAQAVIMMIVVNAAGELHANNLVGLAAMAVASSICFMAVNQACVAALAFRGRFVSIVLLSLQITSMGATFPIETTPKFFQWIHPFLPMSYTQLSFRRLIAGAGVDGIYGQTMAVLLAWTVAAVLITLLGARFRRGKRPLPADNALAPTAA